MSEKIQLRLGNKIWEMWTLCCLILSGIAAANAERIYGQGTTRRVGGLRVDPNEMYVRIQAELIKLTNEKGLTSVNSYCDTLGSCDPVCYAHLDTDRPNAEWPGGVALDYWPEILRVDNNNSPFVNKTITRDSCAKPYRESVLRVYCEDYDPASSNDLINQWECPITRNPADSENGAPWSQVADCTPRFHPGSPNSIRLSFRYRLFNIARSRCDATTQASTPRSATTASTKARAG